MDERELIKLTPAELVDLGVCPTCLNRKYHGAIYGDDRQTLLYRDGDIEIFFVGNPRAVGHAAISSIEHYHDLSEAPDGLNGKIMVFARELMRILKAVYGCERTYLCSMCDGPNNHYHVQLIPRYTYEMRGSRNFVKARSAYVFDAEKLEAVRAKIAEYAKSKNVIGENVGVREYGEKLKEGIIS